MKEPPREDQSIKDAESSSLASPLRIPPPRRRGRRDAEEARAEAEDQLREEAAVLAQVPNPTPLLRRVPTPVQTGRGPTLLTPRQVRKAGLIYNRIRDFANIRPGSARARPPSAAAERFAPTTRHCPLSVSCPRRCTRWAPSHATGAGSDASLICLQVPPPDAVLCGRGADLSLGFVRVFPRCPRIDPGEPRRPP